jgi:thymidine kinase
VSPFALTPSLYGHIEVICGPMFSGKTEELIRRVKRAQIARQRVQIFKPKIDDRYHEENVVSHSSQSIQAKPIGMSHDILEHLYDSTRVVAIDEVQFFDEDVIPVVKKLVRRGIRVILAGLDQDYRGIPFGPIPHLMAIADRVDKVQAICTVCGGAATKSFRKILEDEGQVLVGETDIYEARCGNHFEYNEEEELISFRQKPEKASETTV